MPNKGPVTESAANGFAATSWTLVLGAAQGEDTRARDALAELCRVYWYPLYAFIRRLGHHPDDAKDLTQAFFARFLEHHGLANVDPTKGRFRSFLLTSVRNFLANEWQRAQCQKRGGGCTVVPLDTGSAETRYGVDPADHRSPDKLFDRAWALTLLDQAMNRLAAEQRQAGKEVQFDRLRDTLMADPEAGRYAVLAAELDSTPEALRMAVNRLRRRYRELLRAEVARTLSPEASPDEELRHLLAALRD